MESPKIWGQCPECKSWNTFNEFDEKAFKKTYEITNTISAKPTKIVDIPTDHDKKSSSYIPELDRILGGGIVASSLVLIGGSPGVGKSTILLQMCHNLSINNKKVLYASGEESLSQIKMRLDRLCLKNSEIYLLASHNPHEIVQSAKELKADLVVIDSIQTLNDPNVSSSAGSVSQVRNSTTILMDLAKVSGITTFIVGHITKDGTISGPKTIEHMVDTVLYFEGIENESIRIIKANKNRFGSTNEVGMFQMTKKGLISLESPSAAFLEGRVESANGSAVTVTMEGSRACLIEVQGLASSTSYSLPKRMCSGFEYNRFILLLAVIEKFTSMKIYDKDIYLNIIGGIKIEETGTDLGIICSIISSIKNKPINSSIAMFGEVGLCSEIRRVSNPVKRINEAYIMGFNKVIVPKNNLSKEDKLEIKKEISIIEVSSLQECLNNIF